MTQHPWDKTIAAELLASSRFDPEGSGKRFATARGMAFVAHDTRDGTWHGYPIPWNDVPSSLKDDWREAELVKRRDLKRYADFDGRNIDWALGSDDG